MRSVHHRADEDSYIYPARHGGLTTSPRPADGLGPAQASYDVSGLSRMPGDRRRAQQYGMILATTVDWYLSGMSDSRFDDTSSTSSTTSPEALEVVDTTGCQR